MNIQKPKCARCGALLNVCACRRAACEELADGEPLAFVDGHDGAILGFAEVEGAPRVVYDRGAIIEALMLRDGMDEEGAIEFFEYNIAGARLGPPAPCFVELIGYVGRAHA